MVLRNIKVLVAIVAMVSLIVLLTGVWKAWRNAPEGSAPTFIGAPTKLPTGSAEIPGGQSSQEASLSRSPHVTRGPRGIVRTADGKPLAKAEVVLASPGVRLQLYSQVKPKAPMVKTGNDGSFQFPEQQQEWAALVVRSPVGFALVPTEEFPADGVIIAEPWGRIEGTLLAGDRPMPNETVAVHYCQHANSWDVGFHRWGIDCDRFTTTDGDGRFVFAQVMPGPMTVARQWGEEGLRGTSKTTLESPSAFAAILPGETTRVTLGGGRTVVGRAVPSEPSEPLRIWGQIGCTQSSMPVPQNWPTMTWRQRQQHFLTWSRSNEGWPTVGAWHSSQYFICDADGKFQIDNTPPGIEKRVLSIQAFVQDPGSDYADQVVSHRRLVDVPPRGEGPIDLGSITIEVKRRIVMGEIAPDIQLIRADGSSAKLSDYRGKHLVLDLGAEYRGYSPGDTRIIQDRFGKNAEILLLGIVRQAPAAPESSWLRVLRGSLKVSTVPATMPSSPSVPASVRVIHTDTEKGVRPTTMPFPVRPDIAWPQARIAGVSQLPPEYSASPLLLVVLGPDGRALLKTQRDFRLVYDFLDRLERPGNSGEPGVIVVANHLAKDKATPAFKFDVVPPIAKDDAGSKATWIILDGNKAGWVGPISVLNDGVGPANAASEKASFGFQHWTMEGRILADLGKKLRLRQINTYSWHSNGNRTPHVYRVYGGTGDAPNFDPGPRNGVDPATCGWTPIAWVDTRTAPGGTDLRDGEGGQTGVSIQGAGGPIGSYRYLLFLTFATEMKDIWGQTFFSEIDIVEEK